MRPVNLIPSEERTGELRPLRGGPLAYIVVGALALVLIGVSLLVVTGNQISEREAESQRLEQATSTAEARANELAAYTQFRSVREARVATVASLADSRFDWERVMRELALVLPADIWLTNLTGTVSPAVSPEGAGTVGLRSTVPGPALELIGCGRSQDSVAGFVQVLKDIDGVTRVGVQGSALGTSDSGGGGVSTCQTRPSIAQFQIVVAFDAAPVAAVAGGEAGSAPTAAPPAEAAGEGEGETEEGGGEAAAEGDEAS